VTGAEALLDACAICECEEGGDKVVWVRDGIDVDSVVVCRGLVGKFDNGLRLSLCCREGKGVEDSGVGPGKASQDTKHQKEGGE